MLAVMKSQQRDALYPTPVPPIAVDFSPRSGPQKGPGFSPNERVARHAQRLAFVEHVCGVLIESRSGQPPVAPWDIFEGPVENAFYAVPVYDLMPDWAFDLMPKGGFMPDFVLGRAGFVSGCSGFVPAYSSSIAPGFSPGSGYPTNQSPEPARCRRQRFWDARIFQQ